MNQRRERAGVLYEASSAGRQPAQAFGARALGRPPTHGRRLVLIPSTLSAEVMAAAGFDWVCIDTPHGLIGYEAMTAMLQALDARGAPTFVRVPWNEPRHDPEGARRWRGWHHRPDGRLGGGGRSCGSRQVPAARLPELGACSRVAADADMTPNREPRASLRGDGGDRRGRRARRRDRVRPQAWTAS